MIFLSYVALYLLLFDLDMPFFRGIGSAPFSLIISFTIIILNKYSYKARISKIFKEFDNILVVYTLLVFYACFRVLFDQVEEPSYIGTSLKGFTIFIASLLYLIAFDTENTEVLFEKLLNVFFINASIALFVGTFQEYQSYVDWFKPGGEIELIGWTPYRNAFLAGSGYFGIGAPFGVASAFFLIYIFTNKKFSIVYTVKLISIILAAIFAARTVFLCLMIALLYLVIVRGSVKALIGSTVLSFVGMVLLNLDVFKTYHIWLFEFFDKGIKNSDSGRVLLSLEFLKIPNDTSTFLFGDGKYVSLTGGYYMGTDIGYLRHWYFGGLGFMLAVTCIPFLMYIKNRDQMFLFVIISISLMLHFKGVFIYNNPAFTPLLMLISHILYKSKV